MTIQHLSEHGRDLLVQWEGLRLRSYICSAGHYTIGVGHVITTPGFVAVGGETIPVEKGITEGQAFALLREDLVRFEACVTHHVKVPLLQHQYDALVIFCFNVGTRAFENSTLLKLLNRRDYDSVPAQLRRWTKAGAKVIPGLVNRRENEVRLWLGELA